jgi:hypothetical protein
VIAGRDPSGEKPPLHLALGNDALRVMDMKIANLQQDIAAWKPTSASVAFPEATGSQTTAPKS